MLIQVGVLPGQVTGSNENDTTLRLRHFCETPAACGQLVFDTPYEGAYPDTNVCSIPNSVCRLLFWFALANAVPAVGGNILRVTEREPDCTCGNTGLDRLVRGYATNVAEHKVVREDPAVGRAKLVFNGQPELTQTHTPTLPARAVLPLRGGRKTKTPPAKPGAFLWNWGA